jgi:hypothetical protein
MGAAAGSGEVMTRLRLFALALLAMAAAPENRVVPIEQEPRHVLKFQNPHVRVFDVHLPPGYESLYHSHLHDGVFVNVEASETVAQDLGGEPVTRPPREPGETYFINYTLQPKAHRVGNTGRAFYRVVDTEIHQGCRGSERGPDPPGQTLILENDRVRVMRVRLAPGEKTTLRASCGLLVAVSKGSLAFKPAGADENVDLEPAGFTWREAFEPLPVQNAGQTLFQGVDIVIK